MFNEIEQESSSANYDISQAMSTKSQAMSTKSHTRSNDIESGLAELEAKIETLKDYNYQLLEGLMESETRIVHIDCEVKDIANFISEWRALKQEKLSEIYEAEAAIGELNYQIQVLSEEIQHIESNLEEYYSYYYNVKNQSDNYENYIDVLFEYINNGIRTDEEWEEAQQLYNWLRSDMEDRVAELEAALENLFASIDNR
jgi:chromosome segregation ATPase